MVAEMRAEASDTREEKEKQDEQEGNVSLMEKPSISQIREAINSLFNFASITGNKEMQHIAINASKTAEMELTQTAKQSYTTNILCELIFSKHVCFSNICVV